MSFLHSPKINLAIESIVLEPSESLDGFLTGMVAYLLGYALSENLTDPS